MAKYRKKPVEIEAQELTTETALNILTWIKREGGQASAIFNSTQSFPMDLISIHTLEGEMKANAGDFVIQGVNGEFYACKPDIFWKTYEAV